MTRTHAVLGLMLTALAGACLYVWQQLQATRDETARLAQVQAPPAHVPSPAAPAPVSEARAPFLTPSPGVASTLPQPVDYERMKRDPAYERAVYRDPAYRATYIEKRILFARESMKDMVDWVPLSAGAFETYLELEANQVLEMAEVRPETAEEGASAEFKRQGEEVARRHEAELKQLFGASYPQYLAYRQATHSRLKITVLNQQLPAEALNKDRARTAAMAMSDAEEGVVRALQAEWGLASLGRYGQNQPPDRRIELERRKTESVRAAVKPLLSATQFKLLDERLTTELASNEAYFRRQPPTP